MRSDLAAVEGVSKIETDIDTQICKFEMNNKQLDLKAKLTELAKTNEHIADFEVVEAKN